MEIAGISIYLLYIVYTYVQRFMVLATANVKVKPPQPNKNNRATGWQGKIGTKSWQSFHSTRSKKHVAVHEVHTQPADTQWMLQNIRYSHTYIVLQGMQPPSTFISTCSEADKSNENEQRSATWHMLQDICQSIHTHTRTHNTHTYRHAYTCTYIVYVFCVHWPFCTLRPIRIWLSGNFWLFFCQILPVCLINFSVFHSFPLLFSLFCSLLFCFAFYSFCCCIRSATKVLKQFLSQDFVSSNCLLFAANLLQVHPLHTPLGGLEKFSVCKLQFAYCVRRGTS